MVHVSEEVLRLQIEGLRAMSPVRKLEIAAGLRAFAWETKLANLRLQHPNLPEGTHQTLLREIFGHAGA